MSRAGDHEAGFTLLELLVAMAVIAMLLVLAPALAPRSGAGVSIEAAARGIASGLRLARSEAMAGGRTVAFTLDFASRSYGVAGRETRGLPDGIVVETRTANTRAGAIGGQAADVLFHPDGTSTGGRIVVSGDGRTRTIAVDWLTGRVATAE